MKKIGIIIAFVGLLVAPVASAETLYGFLDGKLYDTAGSLKYICFMSGECLDKDNNVTTRQALGLQPAQETALLPTSPSINNTPTPTPTPAPAPTPSPTPAPVVQEPVVIAPAFNPFAGNPYIFATSSVWNAERTIESPTVTLGVNLTKSEASLAASQNYSLWCTSPLYPQGATLDYARPAYNQLNKAVASITAGYLSGGDLTFGHYTCQFKFILPEGTFLSNAIEFNIAK